MIAHICDQCGGDVGNTLYTATPKNERTRHFCAVICLSAWATTNGHRQAPPKPEPKPPAPAPAPSPVGPPTKHAPLTPDEDDEILRLYQRHTPVSEIAAKFEISKPTVYNAINRAKERARPAPTIEPSPSTRTHALIGQLVDGVADKIITAPARVDDSTAPASETRPKPEPSQVNPAAKVDETAENIPENMPPAPTRFTTPRKPPITARCTTCSRSWNLTGRVLMAAIDLHERKHDGHVVDILDQEATNA